MSGLLPGIIFPADIRAVQSELRAASAGVDLSFTGCPQIDPGTRSAWAAANRSIKEYCDIDVGFTNTTASLYETGLNHQKALYEWQELLKGSNCALKSPQIDFTPPLPPINDALKWTAIIAVSVAGMYGISKVVEAVSAIRPVKSAASLPAKGIKS